MDEPRRSRSSRRSRTEVNGFPSCSSCLRGSALMRPSANFDEPELLLPLLLHEGHQLAGQAAGLHHLAGFAMGVLHDLAVTHQIAGAELRQAGLARPEKVAGPPQLE